MKNISLLGIICTVVGISIIIYAEYSYEYRSFAYRYLPSLCPEGSSCPYPGLDYNLVWLGIYISIAGVVLLSIRKLKQRKQIRK